MRNGDLKEISNDRATDFPMTVKPTSPDRRRMGVSMPMPRVSYHLVKEKALGMAMCEHDVLECEHGVLECEHDVLE